MKGLCDQSSPQMRSVGSHSTSGREKEGIKERMKKIYMDLLSMEPWAAAKKKLSFSVAVPPAPVRVPSQRPLKFIWDEERSI